MKTKYSIKKYTCFILILLTIFNSLSFYVYAFDPPSSKSFNDTKNHWAEKAIDKWANLNVLNGYDDRSFLPNKKITKAELSVILNTISGCETMKDFSFEDLNKDDWYSPYILKALTAGYLETDSRLIQPNEFVKRQDAIMAIGKMLHLEPGFIYKDYFTDSGKISENAKPYVNAMAEKGYIIGKGNNEFRPDEIITRAEIVQIFDNAISNFHNKPFTRINENIGNEKGIIVINSPEVQFENIEINSNIVITEKCKSLLFNNAAVNGKIFANMDTRIALKNNSYIDNLKIKEESSFIEISSSDTSYIKNLYIIGRNSSISIKSNFHKTSIDSYNSIINISDSTIDSLEIKADCSLNISKSADIVSLTLNDNLKNPYTNNTSKSSVSRPASNVPPQTSSPDEKEDENNTIPDEKPLKYTVTFDGKGGMFSGNISETKVDIKENTAIGLQNMPSSPYRNNYIFSGWSYADNSGSPNFTYNSIITKDITIYALWEPKPVPPSNMVCVTFDANGGYFFDASQIYQVNIYKNSIVSPQESIKTPLRNGYEFLGWSYGFLSSLPDFNISYPFSSDITIYAVWKEQATEKPLSLKVTFYSNGGMFLDESVSKQIKVDKGTLINIENVPALLQREGYVFLGWSLSEASAVADFHIETAIKNHTVLYAIWEKSPEPSAVNHTVVFDANGGNFPDNEPVKSFEVQRGAQINAHTLINDFPSRDNYDFLEWSLEKNPDEITSDYDIVVYQDLKFYAIWKKHPDSPIVNHTVTFDANKGTFPDEDLIKTFEIADGSEINVYDLIKYEPLRDDYYFIGWGLEKTSPEAITDHNTTIYGPLHFYALWEQAPKPINKKYTVIFFANGGVFPDSELEKSLFLGTWEEINDDTFISIPSRDGYEFLGWSCTPESSVPDFDQSHDLDKNLNLYAVWQPEENGTIDAPFLIYNFNDLQAIGKDQDEYSGWTMNSVYKLANDIDMENHDLIPIGANKNKFNGIFIGNNKSIKNIHYKSFYYDNSNTAGIFGYTGKDAVIKDLYVSGSLSCENAENNSYYFGFIAAFNEGVIENCHADSNSKLNNIEGIRAYIGGISGSNSGDIKFSSSDFELRSNGDLIYLGGIAGENTGYIESCKSILNAEMIQTTKETNLDRYIGGISGNNTGNINNSYAITNIVSISKGTEFCGGITGKNSGTIEFCYAKINTEIENTGLISYYGGIAGYNSKAIRSCVLIDSSFNCKANMARQGRISGYSGNQSVFSKNYVYDSIVLITNGKNTSISNSVSGKDGKTIKPNQLKDILTEINWPFDDVNGYWVWDDTELIPVLKMLLKF